MCEQRTCIKCNETKDLTPQFFYQSKKHVNGFNTKCRACCVAETIADEKARREAQVGWKGGEERQRRHDAMWAEANRKEEVDQLLLVGLKECSCCKQVLPTDDFALDSRSYSGFQAMCKSCKKEARK